jgi:hypothetical protein
MNIAEFFQNMIDALQKYISVHYVQASWYEDWVGLSDIRKYYASSDGVLGNQYFLFHWKEAAYRKMAERYTLYRCPECESINEEQCPDHDVVCIALTEDEAFEYFYDCGYTLEEKDLYDSLMEDGWARYCQGTHPRTDPVKAEILECLTAISQDETKEDQLVHLMWTLKIMHVNGSIAADYGDMDFGDVDFIRRNGLAAYFGEEEVSAFLRGDSPGIEVDLALVREVETVNEAPKDQPVPYQIGQGT